MGRRENTYGRRWLLHVLQFIHLLRKLRVVTFVFIVAARSYGQGTFLIAFEGPPVLAPGAGVYVSQYSEAGVCFAPLPSSDGFVRAWAGDSRDPDNGTLAFLTASLGDSLMFTTADGSPFNLHSIDLGEYSTVVPDAVTVPIVGYRSHGSTVTLTFTTDGIIDGTGPLADFQRFYFDSRFSALTRVEIPAYGWSLDNLVVSIPEPTSIALLAVGTSVALAARGRRNRKDV